MTEVDSEESFVFVDKRKLGSESAVDSVAQPEPSDVNAGLSDQLEDEHVEEDLSGLAGSHGLVAYVIGLIASDAWQKLGLIADTGTGKVIKDLKQARFSIDCVAALVGVIEKSEVELPTELQRDLKRALADLQLNYVEQSRRV